MSVTLTMEGTDKVIATLDQFTNVGLRKVIRAAMREGAKVAADKAKSLVTDDTGELRRSIKVKAGKADRGSVGIVVIMEQPNAPYGSFVELGHKHGKRSKGANRQQVLPHPFMRPAFDNTRAQIEEHIHAAVDRLIEETNG